MIGRYAHLYGSYPQRSLWRYGLDRFRSRNQAGRRHKTAKKNKTGVEHNTKGNVADLKSVGPMVQIGKSLHSINHAVRWVSDEIRLAVYY